MKFSFSLVPTMPLPAFGEIIRQAEDWGFDLVWVPDQGFLRDPFASIAHVATVTKRIGLGVGITNPYSRHPMQTARVMATLADLRQGQIVLGIGAGEKVMRDAIGAPTGSFVDTVREMIRSIRALYAGEKLDLTTPVFSFHNAAMEFRPQNPVPIYLASTHPDAFRVAGELADGVIVGDVSDARALQSVLEKVREGAEAAGRDLSDIAVVAWVATVCTDDQAEAADVRRLLRENVMGPTIGTMHKSTREALGISPDQGKAIREAFRARQPITADMVSDELIDRLALVGDADILSARLEELGAAGVDLIGMRMPVAIARAYDFQSNIKRLAERVLPAASG